MSAQTAYDQDYYLWFADQARLLRAGTWQQIDVEHLAEELEDMDKREKRSLRSRAVVLLAHLLKYRYEPQHRSASWAGTIREQRKQLAGLLSDSPSLRPQLQDELQDSYISASLLAPGDTGLAEALFPEQCPFSIDQLIDPDYWADG